MTKETQIMPPFDPLEIRIATRLCQFKRVTRDMPSMAEIHRAMPYARSLIKEITSNEVAFDQIEKLTAFKTYVHQRMDEAGVPVDPDSPHKAAGCRIGGRLDVLIGERDELRKELAEAVAVVADARIPAENIGYQNLSQLNSKTDRLARIDAFLARNQPPSAVDTQQVNRE